MVLRVQYALRRIRPRTALVHHYNNPADLQSRTITVQPDEHTRKYAIARRDLQEEDVKHIQDLRRKANNLIVAIKKTDPVIAALSQPVLLHRQDRNPQELLPRQDQAQSGS